MPLLDRQSGIRPVSGSAKLGKATSRPSDNTAPNDTGGASRFYPQFASLAEAVDWLQRLIGP